MSKAKLVSGVVALAVTTPIWFYLIYQILDRVQASELMWFLYWVYVPTSFFVSVLAKIAESKD